MAGATAWAQATPPPPTEGSLYAVDKDNKPLGACPLEHTDVVADISGFIARVTVTQRFTNPFPNPIEAVYTFPMSERAAVDTMNMTVGDRVIKGVIKRREEARRAYEAAKAAGQAASLLDQERTNIFTQSVANILPNSRVEITISYVEYLVYKDGAYAFSFPMVVGPRYIPGNVVSTQGTDQVPDAARISPPVTPEGTRAGHDISLEARIDAGVNIGDLKSDLHEVDVERPSAQKAVVKLKDKNEIPNRDFILHYDVAGDAIQDAILAHTDARGGFFTLILQAPDRVPPEAVTPKEMIFVIDCSGSMRGFPIEKAKEAMRLCIEQMNPNDTFNLVSFSGGTGYCFERPVPNTADNRAKALSYLSQLEGSGGTEMMSAIRAALEGQNDDERLRIVCFMTDGFIGNDTAILDAIQKNVGTARVFSFGIGNSVNRFLIEGMGRYGRGASEVVTLQSQGDDAAKRFHERVDSPILTDISLDLGRLPVKDLYPDPNLIPDLFAAQPLVITGRYTGSGRGTLVLKGKTPRGPFERRMEVVLPGNAPEHDVLATLWAREKIESLMSNDWLAAQRGEQGADSKEPITQLGLEYNLVTQYTSFVAIEERKITEGGKTQTVQVPLEMPDGVSYEGVFGTDSTNNFALGAAAGGVALKSRAMAMPMSVAPVAAEVAPPAATAAPAPVRQEEAKISNAPAPMPAEKPSLSTDSKEKEWEGKIDPALKGLAAKLVNGRYEAGAVKVEGGMMRIFITLSDDSDDCIAALEKAGARIVSHTRAGKKVLAQIRVEDLQKIAELSCVRKINPPQF
jgi:Ca-activated chloride channel family protein